jgi:hypothetical protein
MVQTVRTFPAPDNSLGSGGHILCRPGRPDFRFRCDAPVELADAELFGFHTLTFLQAFGLVLLVKLLFGSGFHDHFEKHHKRRFPHWEERRRFRNFWNEEGRAAFDAYVRKNRSGNDTAE